MAAMQNRLSIAAALLLVMGCSKEQGGPSGSPSASASATAATPASATASASSPPAASSAPAPSEPPHDCPAGSTGTGSFSKPCDAKGNARMMTVQWKKTGDSGPSFAVTNKGKLVIVWGKIAVYFYDKAGKQLDVATTDDSAQGAKSKKFHTCSGQFFGGIMNPAEREVLTFSCVPKTIIPDGTSTIEAEMQMVGFADPTGKKIDFYWRNSDLTPDARPKGGVK
jgi:hypothetical protein